MAGQQQQIAETIFNLKRKLRSQDEDSEPDEYLAGPPYPLRRDYLTTSRKVNHLQNEAIEPLEGPPTYKRKLEHAGYKRYVLRRNPPKFDIDGDIIDEELDEDEDEDITTLEENPYADLRLEHILAPLTSAAELPNHPSLSIPYLTKHLTNLADESRTMSHKEQKTLWKAKELLAKLMGDDAWAPMGMTITDLDKAMLEGNMLGLMSSFQHVEPRESGPSKALNLGPSLHHKDSMNGAQLAPSQASGAAALLTNGNPLPNGQNANLVNGQVPGERSIVESLAVQHPDQQPSLLENGINGAHINKPDEHPNGVERVNGVSHMTNGVGSGFTSMARPGAGDHIQVSQQDDNSATDSTLQPLSHRMTTRARASGSSSTSSPAPSSSQLVPPIHPFFEFPQHLLCDPDFDLPPAEAEETRMALFALIQKREEISRNSLELYHGLLHADRLRKDVLNWTKAEGHIGEMSDGEDWYDKEDWGLEEDLVKGREEEDEDLGTSVKKTRQRRGAKEDK